MNLYNIKKDPAWATQALDAANKANVINSNLAEVHFSLGQVYNVTGKSTEAVAELRRALELAPNSDEGYRRLGDVYSKTGQKAEALKALQQAVDANPFYWPNHYSLGTAYYQFGDNDRALKAFQRVTELEPNNATSLDHYRRDTIPFEQLERIDRCLQESTGLEAERTDLYRPGHVVLFPGAVR